VNTVASRDCRGRNPLLQHSTTAGCLCASLHGRRGDSALHDTDFVFVFVFDICDCCAPLTGGDHPGAQSQSRTFVQSRRFSKAVLAGCIRRTEE